MKKKNDGVKAVGRVSAVIAMVVLILAAIPVGACISLSRERNNVTAEYYGSDDVYGVLDQVSMMVSEASNLVTIAEKYSETDLTLVDAVRTAQNAVKKAERPADKYAALNDLTTAVKAMYRQIKNIDMNEEDATYRESLMSNYNSDLDYLMRDDYNDKAAAFNDALRMHWRSWWASATWSCSRKSLKRTGKGNAYDKDRTSCFEKDGRCAAYGAGARTYGGAGVCRDVAGCPDGLCV